MSVWLSEALRGRREAWAEGGWAFEAFLTLDSSAHVAGGLDPDSSAFRGLFDALLDVDTERAFGWEGGRFTLGLQALGGEDGSAEVGVLQNYSNIDAADDRFQLARLWYEQTWGDGATALRVGKMDANGLFAGVENAARFLHSSMGYSPTILGLPTYPDPAYGVVLRQRLGARAELGFGLYDGAGQTGVKTGERGLGSVFGDPEDLFLIAQASGGWGGGTSAGRLAAGLWEHTGDFARFAGGEEEHTSGLYAVLEQGLELDARPLELFLQLGEADEEVSAITTHVGCGISASGLFLPEREDALGFGVSWAELSDEPGAGFSAEAETAFELFYGFRLAPGVRLKPDVQYIADPGGDASVDDAWVLTLRITAAL